MLNLIFDSLKKVADEINNIEDSALDTAKSILSETIDTVEQEVNKLTPN